MDQQEKPFYKFRTLEWRFKDAKKEYPDIKFDGRIKITSPEDSYTMVKNYFADLSCEHFGVLYLSSANKPIGFEIISIGNLNSSVVHPREVSRGAIVTGCASIILFDFQGDDELSKDQIKKLLGDPEKNIDSMQDEIDEYNLDYYSECADNFYNEKVIPTFSEELKVEFKKEYPDEDEEWIDEEIKDYVRENFSVSVSFNIRQLIKRQGNVNCLIRVFSNYDCTNSFDTLETSDYLRQVYQRVKPGVRKQDFIWEHINGAYGGSIFCFAFSTDLENLISLKTQLKKGNVEKILVPKGTQFGFHSSFQGSASPFEKTTYQNFHLNISESGGEYNPAYDNVDIVGDLEQNYSLDQIFGGIDMDEQTIKLEEAKQ